MLTEQQHEEIYLSSKNDEQAGRDSLANTVYSLFIPLREGETDIEPDIRPVRSERFGVDVLPGHPALSNIEDVMSDAWQSSLAKKTRIFGESTGPGSWLWLWRMRIGTTTSSTTWDRR